MRMSFPAGLDSNVLEYSVAVYFLNFFSKYLVYDIGMTSIWRRTWIFHHICHRKILINDF